VTPIADLRENLPTLRDDQKDLSSVFRGSAVQNRVITMINLSTTNEERNTSCRPTRNHGNLHFTSVIPEHEEEGKGTIDFRNRNFLENTNLDRPGCFTQREEEKFNNNDSFNPLIEAESNSDEERKSKSEERKSILLDEQKHPPESDDGEERSIHEQLQIEERKRSISAQEPVRKLPKFEQQNDIHRHVAENKFFENEQDEEIEELINDFYE
jgi:hypothetical protein